MSEAKAKVGIVGVSGRMGQRVVRLLEKHPILELAVGLERPGTEVSSVIPVRVVHDVQAAVDASDVLIDFSAPASCTRILPACAAARVPCVVASTGMSPQDHEAVRAAAQKTAIVQAANLSRGINVMLELVETAARRLGVDYDIEISEIHHRYKKDAPSGTALALGQAAEHGRGPMCEVHGRAGVEESRRQDELGYAAIRGGDVSGDHTVYFLADGERLEITHRSSTADIFATGALQAAAWLLERAPGLYSMRDVLAQG